MDENDNAPEFPEEEYVTVLSEGPDTVGATIATVTAIDPDEGLNGTLRYAISQGNLIQTFHINSVTVSWSGSVPINIGNNVLTSLLCVCVCSGEDHCSERAGLWDQQWALHLGRHGNRPVSQSCPSLDFQHDCEQN